MKTSEKSITLNAIIGINEFHLYIHLTICDQQGKLPILQMDLQDTKSVIYAIENNSILEYSHTNIELKSSWKQDNGKKISFLANKNLISQSWLIIGIDDDGKVLFNEEQWVKSTEEQISQHLNLYLDPIQCIKHLKAHKLNNGYWVFIIGIINPGIVVRWNKKPYKGIGTTLLEMEPDEVMQLTIQLPGLHDYSSQKSNDTLDSTLVKSFAMSVNDKQNGTFFKDLHHLSADDVLSRLKIKNTIAANLLFGNISFRIVVYDNDNIPIINETHHQLFNLLSESLLDKIQKNVNDLNKTTTTLSITSIKEGLANAVAHAAYFEDNGDIILEIYNNRLIINNLCLPESRYFANKWFSRSHKTVNNLLMETLRLSGHVDELGRGKNLIYTESIKHGHLSPEVIVEKAGRYDRWRLIIYSESINRKDKMMLGRLKKMYDSDIKAQIANALVLWRNKKVSEIKKYIDGESFPLFEEILKDFNGPVFYYEKDDSLNLRRWSRIIIEEGQDSKTFTTAEEESILTLAYEICTKYHHDMLTVKYFRELARMGNSSAEVTLSSNTLKKWAKSGILQKVKKGTYMFIKSPDTDSIDHNLLILKKKLTSN